jgi:hypothetical protein
MPISQRSRGATGTRPSARSSSSLWISAAARALTAPRRTASFFVGLGGPRELLDDRLELRHGLVDDLGRPEAAEVRLGSAIVAHRSPPGAVRDDAGVALHLLRGGRLHCADHARGPGSHRRPSPARTRGIPAAAGGSTAPPTTRRSTPSSRSRRPSSGRSTAPSPPACSAVGRFCSSLWTARHPVAPPPPALRGSGGGRRLNSSRCVVRHLPSRRANTADMWRWHPWPCARWSAVLGSRVWPRPVATPGNGSGFSDVRSRPAGIAATST